MTTELLFLISLLLMGVSVFGLLRIYKSIDESIQNIFLFLIDINKLNEIKKRIDHE